MENVIDIIVNNGVSVGVLLYFMYIQNNSLKELTKSLDSLKEIVLQLDKEVNKR